jgi:uncharacterized cupredoxin-like copper-binding protein
MRLILIAVSLLALSPAVVSAHDAHSHGGHVHGAAVEGGAPGKAADATRTVTIVATDSTFSPKAVAVKSGETIRFIVRNNGKLVHELTIGTKAMQAEHQSEMLGFAVSGAIEADKVDRARLGTHDHGNNVLLEPGQSGEVVWTFAKAGDLEFGCNIPGHYEAGMKGDFKFE